MSEAQSSHNIVILDARHRKEAIELFSDTFCKREPITKHLHLTREDFLPFANEVIDKAIQDKMSMVALDKNKHVIAFVIAEDLANPLIPHLNQYPKMKPVIALLEETSKPFLDHKSYHPGSVAHVWIAAIEEKYARHGLFTELNAATIEWAAQMGFNFAYAEFTNEISEKIVKQFKLITPCNRIKYEDFVLDSNQKPFKGLKGSAVSYYAAIRPGVKLDGIRQCYDPK